MNTFNSIPDQMYPVESELALNIQRRHSFPAPDESSRGIDHDDVRGEDHESTTSECTSAVLSSRPMSTTVSSAEDEGMLHKSHTKLLDTTLVHHWPESSVQPAESQVYASLIYNQQYQHGHNCITVPMRISSLGYAPITIQSVPKNMPMPWPMQQQGAHTIQQSYSVPQNWSHVPQSTSAIPYIAYPQQSNPEIHWASVDSSTVSTPIFSCVSSSGQGRNYGCMKTPQLSSTSCSPIQGSLPYPDAPPSLNLDQNITQTSMCPRCICCNISLGSVSSFPGTTVSLDAAFANSTKKKAAPPRYFCFERVVEKFEKGAVRGNAILWNGSLNYEEYKWNGGSNLFITWSGLKTELVDKLQSYRLDVREVLSTSDQNVCNVIFESHPTARKAFTMQQQIRLRMVPPKRSHRYWLRNPAPSFLVKFETKCRLSVRKGKAECHDVVGELLKGCLITADQLKGNRIRVRYCEGSLMFPGGKIVEIKGKNSGVKSSLGWISYRSKHSNESYVIRRSWNTLGEYIYNK